MHVSWMGGAELLKWFQETATEDFMLVPLAGGTHDRRFFRDFEREGDRLHLLSGDSVAVVLLGALEMEQHPRRCLAITRMRVLSQDRRRSASVRVRSPSR